MANTQVTFDVNPANARNESSIAINPHNNRQMVAASKKFTNPMTYEHSVATSWSEDGGLTWTPSANLHLHAGWLGVSDPVLCWDTHNSVYLITVPFNDTSISALGIGVAVYKSTDRGHTWSDPHVIHRNNPDDHPWIACNKNNGHLFCVWGERANEGITRLFFARSFDQGATWKGSGTEPAGSILTSMAVCPSICVADNGNIYITYIVGDDVMFLASTDDGETFPHVPALPGSGISSLGFLPRAADGFPKFPGTLFDIMTRPTVSAGRNNVVIVAWPDLREGVARIYFRRSVDGGVTWLGSSSGSPLLTGAILGDVHHFNPQLVKQPNGTIACSFYELGPKGVSGKMLIDVGFTTSIDQGQTFLNYHIITDHPWDPATDAPLFHGSPMLTTIGRYFGLDASDLGFYPLWTDTRTGIQELFTSIPFPIRVPNLDRYREFIFILFGIINDGGGVYIDSNGHIHIVPPIGPDPGWFITEMLTHMASYKLSEKLTESKEGKEMQKQALQSIINTAQRQLKELGSGK